MLYLQNITTADFNADFNADFSTPAQLVDIPSNGMTATGTVALDIVHTVERSRYTCGGVVTATLRDYLTVLVTLPEGLAEGEYEYVFSSDGTIISKGLLKVSSQTDKEQYEIPLQYEQYE